MPPQRWHVHSAFNGWTTTNSAPRLAFSARRLRFASESSGDTQWHADGFRNSSIILVETRPGLVPGLRPSIWGFAISRIDAQR